MYIFVLQRSLDLAWPDSLSTALHGSIYTAAQPMPGLSWEHLRGLVLAWPDRYSCIAQICPALTVSAQSISAWVDSFISTAYNLWPAGCGCRIKDCTSHRSRCVTHQMCLHTRLLLLWYFPAPAALPVDQASPSSDYGPQAQQGMLRDRQAHV
jgi:hypothetical protein